MKYLKLFENFEILTRNEWRDKIQTIAQDTLIDLIDNGFITEFAEFVDKTLNFYLDSEDYGFFWSDIKDHFTKFIEMIYEENEIEQIIIYYKSTSAMSRMKPEQILNGIPPSNDYVLQSDQRFKSELEDIRLISIHFKK